MTAKVAIVTGANKGIGFAIVRRLCKRFDGVVYLTSRDIERGKSAVKELEKEGLKPKFHQLDVTDKQSLEVFHDYLKNNYDGIDILVNNAAIVFKVSAPELVAAQAEQTLFVNYFSLLSTCEFLFPLLKTGARVVNLSSSMGHLSNIPSKKLKSKFTDPSLTVPALSELMQSYIDAAKKRTHAAEWGNSSYAVSKVGVTALTMIQQRNLADKDIKVNAVHPGFVDTDMTLHKGLLTIEQGSDAPLYLALDAPDSIKGQFVWFTKEVIRWDEDRSWRLFARELINLFYKIVIENLILFIRRLFSRNVYLAITLIIIIILRLFA